MTPCETPGWIITLTQLRRYRSTCDWRLSIDLLIVCSNRYHWSRTSTTTVCVVWPIVRRHFQWPCSVCVHSAQSVSISVRFRYFLPRDAMQARPMPSCGVRPSLCLCVCLSVCHVRTFCQNEYSYAQTFFTIEYRQTILVFRPQTGLQYFDQDSSNGGFECKGYEKITIFDQYLALSRKRCKIEP